MRVAEIAGLRFSNVVTATGEDRPRNPALARPEEGRRRPHGAGWLPAQIRAGSLSAVPARTPCRGPAADPQQDGTEIFRQRPLSGHAAYL